MQALADNPAFWVLLFANTMEAFFGGHDFWGAVFTLFVGPVLLRVVCELILILFEINDSLSAMRNGHTAVCNAPGSGFAESRALMSFMPQIARHLLGQDLSMPNIATWWCGDKAAQRDVLDDFDSMAIAGAFANNIPGFESDQQVLPANLSVADRARLH